MLRRLVGSALLISTVTVLGACSRDDATTSPDSTVPQESTTTTASTSTTTTTTTAPVPPTEFIVRDPFEPLV